MSAWPDPSRPGVPLNPERDGWHWICGWNNTPFVAEWEANPNSEFGGSYGWFDGGDNPDGMVANGWTYLGPCLTPADHAAAVQAEREACATQLDMMRKAHNDALIGQPHTPDTSIAYGNGAAAIRARGPTPALDAALAQARRETWEKAVEICAAVSGKEHRAALNYPAREEGGDGSREDSLNAALAAMDCAAAIRSAAAGEEVK